MRLAAGETEGESNGFALIAAIVAMLFMSAAAAALMVIVASETVIAANHRRGLEALYAADAMAEWTIHELDSMSDWDRLLSGELRSSFVDGAPLGMRRTDDGLSVDPGEAVNFANCGRLAACSASEIVGNGTGDRPWGPGNPVWQLFAYGPLTSLVPNASVASSLYVLSMVANHPGYSRASRVSSTFEEETRCRHVILLRAEAVGPPHTRRGVQLTVARCRDGQHAPDLPAISSHRLQLVSWHVVQ